MNLQIIKTKNYEIFSFFSQNRDIELNRAHIQSLKDSMTKHGFVQFMPIICDKNLNIIDGQHRFKAAQELKISVYYCIVTISNINELLADLQISKNWKYEDYLKLYLSLGYPEYEKISELKAKYKNVPLSLIIALMSTDSILSRKQFKEGTIKANNKERLSKTFDYILEIKELYPSKTFLYTRDFIRSFVNISNNKKYNQKHFLIKLKYLNGKFIQCISKIHYDNLIQDIYNNKIRKKVNLLD